MQALKINIYTSDCHYTYILDGLGCIGGAERNRIDFHSQE